MTLRLLRTHVKFLLFLIAISVGVGIFGTLTELAENPDSPVPKIFAFYFVLCFLILGMLIPLNKRTNKWSSVHFKGRHKTRKLLNVLSFWVPLFAVGFLLLVVL